MDDATIHLDAGVVISCHSKPRVPEPPKTYAERGSWLAAQRKLSGLTIEQVARKSEWGVRFMSRLRTIEDGYGNASEDEIDFLTSLYAPYITLVSSDSGL